VNHRNVHYKGSRERGLRQKTPSDSSARMPEQVIASLPMAQGGNFQYFEQKVFPF
jgi:hypothetical protein